MTPLMSTYLALMIAIFLEVIATSMLNLTAQFTRIVPTSLTLLCYGASFYFLSVALKTMPIGIAYAIWSGLGIVLIGIIGWILFKQSLDLPAILGIGLIITGVLVINLFSNSIGSA